MQVSTIRKLDEIVIDASERNAISSQRCTENLIRKCSRTSALNLDSYFAAILLDRDSDRELKTKTTELDYSSSSHENNNNDDTIISIDLSGKGLTEIRYFSCLKHLQNANLANNLIRSVSGIEKCTELVDLSLESNRLISLNGLQKMTQLQALELGHNRVHSLSPLKHFVSLQRLSIEGNEVTSLAELSELKNLMELYAGNNAVKNLKEIQHLKHLPKLIILDLSGNSMSKDSKYRLYCIYHLRKLKVLDGVGINTNELSQARDQFSGRLTLDFMIEKLGHENFDRISELDLSSCRIRHIERLSGDDFKNLLELNLDNNFLTSLHGLQNLTKLVVLRINHNRLSVLDSGFSVMV
jgi:hypothetical protein